MTQKPAAAARNADRRTPRRSTGQPSRYWALTVRVETADSHESQLSVMSGGAPTPTHAFLVGALVAITAPNATPASAAPQTPTYARPLLADAVATLPRGTESRAGYQRSSFRHWIDADRDGCSTRVEVLIEEASMPLSRSAMAAELSGGRWYSYYDDQVVTDPSGLDVDHLVSAPATGGPLTRVHPPSTAVFSFAAATSTRDRLACAGSCKIEPWRPTPIDASMPGRQPCAATSGRGRSGQRSRTVFSKTPRSI